MAYNPQAQQLLDMIVESEGPPFTELTPEEARQVPAISLELVGRGPDVAVVRDVEIPGPAGAIPARLDERYNDQIHAFFPFVNLMKSADRAVAEAGAAIRDAVTAKASA